MATSEKARDFSCAQKEPSVCKACSNVSWGDRSLITLARRETAKTHGAITLRCPGRTGQPYCSVLRLHWSCWTLLVLSHFLGVETETDFFYCLGSGGGHLFLQNSTLHSLSSPPVVCFFVQVFLQPLFFLLFPKQMHRKRANSKEFVWKGRLKEPQRGETPRICTYFVYV